jgi:hypothetical protein
MSSRSSNRCRGIALGALDNSRSMVPHHRGTIISAYQPLFQAHVSDTIISQRSHFARASSRIWHVSGSPVSIAGVYQRHDSAREKREALNDLGERMTAIVQGREEQTTSSRCAPEH